MNDAFNNLPADNSGLSTVHELSDRKVLAKKLKHSLFVVAATYTFSVLGAGDLSLPGWRSEGASDSWGLAIVFCLATIFATAVHSFFTGIVAIVTVQVVKRSISRSDSGQSLIPKLILGFSYFLFGLWFGVPLIMLAFWSKGLTLAWLLLHLAITPKNLRMTSYIENGSTSFALVMISLMSALSNSVLIFIALGVQVFLLAMVNLVATTRLYREKNHDVAAQANRLKIRLRKIGVAEFCLQVRSA